MHVDSCLAMCNHFIEFPNDTMYLALDEESRIMYTNKCDQKGDYQPPTIEMMAWLNDTLKRQSEDPNIIWKTSYVHHTLYGAHYIDNPLIIEQYLPLL